MGKWDECGNEPWLICKIGKCEKFGNIRSFAISFLKELTIIRAFSFSHFLIPLLNCIK